MYGLPEDIDLTFLHGKELLQVCIGLNEVILNFHGQVSITVESEFTHMARTGEVTRFQDCRSSALALASFLGISLSTVKGAADGTLTLCFSNEEILEVYDDSKEFESYQIRIGSRLIVV